MVARNVRDVEVAGSNPVTPTMSSGDTRLNHNRSSSGMCPFYFTFLLLLFQVGCVTPTSANDEGVPTPVSFESVGGEKITGVLFRPNGDGPFPAIVALHGCAGLFSKGGKMHPRDLEWGTRLAEWGYVVVYPDSFTTRGLHEICTTTAYGNMPTQIRPRDAMGALYWLQARADVSRTKIGLLGWSNGGSSLLWTIDYRSSLKPAVKADDFKTAIGFYPGCRLAEMDKNWSSRIPLQILIGQLDNWTLPGYCEGLAKRAGGQPPVEITVYSDSYHDFDAPNMPLTQRHNLAYVAGSDRSATIGTNEKARQAAIEKVRQILKDSL